MRKLLISAALAGAALTAAAPASAQPWRLTPVVSAQIRQDINQLDMQINRAQQRRTISPREAASLRREAVQLRRTYQIYQRGGLNRAEVRTLQNGINRLHMRLRLEQRDWDRVPGRR
jgi:hypothetical protein